MTLIRKRNDFTPSFPSVFNRFFTEDLTDWDSLNYSKTNTSIPAVNVMEDNESYEIQVAAPGMKKDDFKLKLENNLLSISSEIHHEKEEKQDDYSRKEFSYESFQRSFSLPEGHVMAENISAKYVDGILYIKLPKREEVKPQPAKEIEIM